MQLAIHSHIGHRIREKRQELGMAPLTLAKALNCPVDELQSYETANRFISIDQLFNIGAALGAPISYFFATDGDAEKRRSSDARDAGLAGSSTSNCKTAAVGTDPAASGTGDLANTPLGPSLARETAPGSDRGVPKLGMSCVRERELRCSSVVL